MNKIDDLIRYIYDCPHQKMVDIEYDKDFGDEIEVRELTDTLLNHGLIKIIDDGYTLVRVESSPKLRQIVDKFGGSFDKYAKSLTEKDDLEKEKLNYEKSIRELEQKNRELVGENLVLQNWDIKFRWAIAFGAFIFGIFIKYLISILYTILQSLTQQ